MATLINDTQHAIIEVGGYKTKFILAPQNDQQAKDFFKNLDIENSCLGSVSYVASGKSTWVRGAEDFVIYASQLPSVICDPQKWLDKKEARFSKYLKVLLAVENSILLPLSVRLMRKKQNSESEAETFAAWFSDDFDTSKDDFFNDLHFKVEQLKKDKNKLFNYPL